VALLILHHIICDGWSMGVLLREIAGLYTAFAPPSQEARPSPLPELGVQYADYAVWQRRWLTGEVLEAQLAYWRDELAGAPALLELPTDRPRPPVQTSHGAVEPVVLTGELTAALRELGRREGITLFMALLAGFQALLHRLSGQDDVLVGSPLANRNRSETEALIGFFVNTLVLRARFGSPEPEGLDVRTLLARARTAALNAYAHQDLPFERLVEELQIERSLAHGPLFQVMFALQNAPVGRLELPGLLLAPMDTGGGTAKFDLTLSFSESGGALAGGLEYNTDLFDTATARRLAVQLEVLLAAAVADPGGRVWELPLLTAAQRSQLLVEWNDTASGYPRDLTLAELFAEQVARRPDAVALVSGGGGLEQVTYGELHRRATALSRRLAGLGAGPEVPVALFAQRSPAAVAGLLAITMAGGFYVPLDPEHPAERLALLLADVGASLLLADRASAARLPATSAKLVLLDGEEAGGGEKAAPRLPRLPVPDNLAYVMYTSGSTGRPKGVGVTHRNVNRLARGGRFAHMGSGQIFLQLAPLAFDASTLEVWGALANGGRLVLAPAGRLSLGELAETLALHEVTTLWLTAGLFHQVVEEAPEGLRHVRQLLAGGDVLSPPHVRRALAAMDRGVLINGYGPTENTTFTCCHSMRRDEVGDERWMSSVPIGQPIADTRVYLLDSALQPVPAGVYGELFAGGDGMARGYFGRPDLTAERFVPDPLGGSPGDRLYRTGDLARWRPEGVVEFLGRRDHQVKLRGFRVEPGEVEAVLAGYPEVRQAAVLVGRDALGGKRLEGYVAGSVEAPALRQHLESLLPPYMVPSVLVVLETLPLTPNGKVDRQALGRAGMDAAGVGGEGGEGGEPRDVLELQLARIWREVLGVPRIGIRDDFFAAGGHSLLALSLMARVREQLGRDLPLAALFQAPTIESMAALLRRSEGEEAPAVSCLVPIQTQGSGRPFFCVHPGGGDVLCYAPLARYLGPDRPFYGLQSRGLSGEAEPLGRIEDMAAL
ncbi:MAG TPA: amino acid adenylation domain-containing protein, partial [Thermoanaerobaculia bacterium]|nr:amino acid adenylation domain-containing protein [Thermoanaerobaculia bacterium]